MMHGSTSLTHMYKQMLGVGLATGAATASTVVYGVSRLVKPTTGGHAPVLQAAQQRSAGLCLIFHCAFAS